MRWAPELTERQAQVLDFIRDFAGECGYPPTRVEIAAYFQWSSPNAAEEHIKALARKGYLKVVPGISRGLIPT